MVPTNSAAAAATLPLQQVDIAASLPCATLSGSAVAAESDDEVGRVEEICVWLLEVVGNDYSNMKVIRSYARAFIEVAGADSVKMILATCIDSDVDECVNKTVHRRLIKRALSIGKKTEKN